MTRPYSKRGYGYYRGTFGPTAARVLFLLLQNPGHPPTGREIAAAVGCYFTRVHQIIAKLRAAGLVRPSERGSARTAAPSCRFIPATRPAQVSKSAHLANT